MPAHYAEHANCPYRLGGTGGKADQEGGLSTTDALGLSSGAAPGTSAGWTFTAPVGTTITGLTYERYIGHSLDPKNSWSPALRADGSIVPGETCLDSVENGETCSVGGPPGTGGEPAKITGLAAHDLSLGIVCQAPAEEECITGATQHAAWATLYGATVTLSDPTPPTLSAPSGALWGPGEAGGFHKGTESVTVSADDVGGGVASIVLSADGRPVETYTAPCNFTFAQPCPSSTGTQTLTLPTTQLSDGTHTLTLVATDAAGNQSTVASQVITVENGAPPPPVGLSATATQTGGSTFTATWSDPDRPACADHGRALPSLPGERLGRVQRSRIGARGRAGDCDGSGRWKLEHRRVADQRSRQRESRQRCAHQRRGPPVQLRRLGHRP